MNIDLTNPIFHDENKARAHLESIMWPDGPVCPHCGETENIKKLKGKSHRAGLHQCNSCRGHFTVTVGTVLERSRIPLHKWVLGFHLYNASKKSLSAHQVHRMIGVTYKTSWFMMHRIHAAMDSIVSGPIGGQNKIVESDETYVGGKARNVHKSKPIPKKHPVVALVERDGEVRAKHLADVTAKNVREHLVTSATRDSYLMSDDSMVYKGVGKEFKGHASVTHTDGEYVRLGGFAHVNTAESFFALVKRMIYGAHHAVSEQHLQRYINAAAFRWNHRAALGFNDAARANAALRGIAGKRLTYRRTNETANA